jgi:WD40 repeat protein
VITDSIQVWNVDTDQVEIIFEDLSQQVNQIAISPDEQVLAVAFTDAMQASLRFDQQSIHLWDLDTLQPLDTPLVGHSSYITSLRFSGDSRLLASGGCGDRDVEGTCDTGELFIWELVTGEPVVGPIHEHTSAIYGLAFDPTGKKLASGSGGPIFYGSTSDYSIALWDTASGQAMSLPLLAASDYEDSLIPGPIYALDFSPNDHLLLSATGDSVFAYDSVIRLWDTSTRQQIQTLNAYNAGIIEAGFTQNGNHIVSISDDGTVRIWERAD